MGSEHYVTISYDSGGTTRTRRLSRRLVLGIFGVTVGIIALSVSFAALYADSIQEQRKTERQSTNEMLMMYQAKVNQLETHMQEAQEIVSRLAGIAGVTYSPSVANDSGISYESHPMLFDRDTKQAADMPSGLPVRGTVVRGFETTNLQAYHPGLDIACNLNTSVRATATGRVDYVGIDTTYGSVVILRHNDSVTTIYGHNASLRVQTGDAVKAGSEIALSGATGKTAVPSVHYEMRIHDKPIHPLEGNHD